MSRILQAGRAPSTEVQKHAESDFRVYEQTHTPSRVCLELRSDSGATDLCLTRQHMTFCRHWPGLQRKCPMYLNVPCSVIYSTRDYQNPATAPGSEMWHSVSFSWVSKSHQHSISCLLKPGRVVGSLGGKTLHPYNITRPMLSQHCWWIWGHHMDYTKRIHDYTTICT